MLKLKSNILITRFESIRICDFGVSRSLDDDTTMTSNMGTRKYMSPEMKEHKKYSFNTDCWSAGCVLYELITLKIFDDIIEDMKMSNPNDQPQQNLQVSINSIINGLVTRNEFKILLGM